MGRFGSLRPARAAANRAGHASERVILSDHALPEPLLHIHKLLRFALEQTANGDARPFADQRRDIFFVDFFLQHVLAFLLFGHLLLRLGQFALRGGEFPVTNLGNARQIAGTLVALLFRLQLIDCPL